MQAKGGKLSYVVVVAKVRRLLIDSILVYNVVFLIVAVLIHSLMHSLVCDMPCPLLYLCWPLSACDHFCDVVLSKCSGFSDYASSSG